MQPDPVKSPGTGACEIPKYGCKVTARYDMILFNREEDPEMLLPMILMTWQQDLYMQEEHTCFLKKCGPPGRN